MDQELPNEITIDTSTLKQLEEDRKRKLERIKRFGAVESIKSTNHSDHKFLEQLIENKDNFPKINKKALELHQQQIKSEEFKLDINEKTEFNFTRVN